MSILPANRISQVEEYYFSVKLKEIDKLRQEGADIINLGIGNPDMAPSKITIDTLTAEANKVNPGNHGYQSYIGIPELRNAFSAWYKKYFHVDLNGASEVLPLIGSKEGIMHISMAFVNEGDEVLIPNPGYPTYSSVSKLVGASMRYYDLKEELNWQPNFEELEQTDLSKVKIMWVNYPNMPTGARATMALFEKLVAFGKKHNILIVNDNPYSFVLNNEQLSILAVDGAKDIAIELNSLSKSGNLSGWRVGMVAAKKEFIDYILRVKSNMDSGMFRPMQVAAAQTLYLSDDWYEKNNRVYSERREVVFEIMDLLKCRYDKNQVGMFVWAKIPDKYDTSAALSDEILYGKHVFITPGIIFGSAGLKYIRISLCTSVELLTEARDRVKSLVIS